MHNVLFIEVQSAFMEQPDFKRLLIDGLHPNDKGHEWMFKKIKPEIEKLL